MERHGTTIGEELWLWGRDYFFTPFQFTKKAMRFDCECRLMGAFSDLTDSELQALWQGINELGPDGILKKAIGNK